MRFYDYLNSFGIKYGKAVGYGFKYSIRKNIGISASEFKNLVEFNNLWTLIHGFANNGEIKDHPSLQALMLMLKTAYDKLENDENTKKKNNDLIYYLENYAD